MLGNVCTGVLNIDAHQEYCWLKVQFIYENWFDFSWCFQMLCLDSTRWFHLVDISYIGHSSGLTLAGVLSLLVSLE